MAEELQQPEEIENRAREFCEDAKNWQHLPYDVVPKATQDAMYEKQLKESLREAAQWRLALKRRTSPPRCLDCGGFDFERLPENFGWMPHPLDPSRKVRIQPESGSLVTLGGRNAVYDTEGNRISGHRAG